MVSILNIGQSALAAAQAGLSTTAHNIANANTPGYSRQEVVQAAQTGQNLGGGFVGRGTDVVTVRRAYDEFLTMQVQTTQSTQSSLDTHLAQITRINNLVADSAAGVAPALQDFFKGVQDLTGDPQSMAARQALLSDGEALAARFNALDNQIADARNQVNSQISSGVQLINSYSKQISALNDSIAKAMASGQPPNDLLDQRDQVIADLSQQVKVNVVSDGQSGFNVYIGNGQPLVIGNKSYNMAAITSAADPNRMELGYQDKSGAVTPLAESSVTGGVLGGLFDFRSQTLDVVQNSLGRVATVMGDAFNAQHRLGLDINGQPGADFFTTAKPVVSPNANNRSAAVATAAITTAGNLTTSDYKLSYDGANYTVTRLSDGTAQTFGTLPQEVDGVTFSFASGTPVAGDSFVVKPTAEGAAKFGLAISDTKQIAAAAPVVTSAPVTNTGTGEISPGTVDQTYPGAPLTSPVTITFNAGSPPTLSGYPGGPTPYTPGSPISFGGVTLTISGNPANGDTFTVKPNTGAGDSRNAALLAAVQGTNSIEGSTTLQGAYAQMVSLVGNKTRELSVTKDAEDKFLDQAKQAQQNIAGVNLDEEAANMLRYQQAYQAAAKVMQTASTLFDTLLNLGT